MLARRIGLPVFRPTLQVNQATAIRSDPSVTKSPAKLVNYPHFERQKLFNSTKNWNSSQKSTRMMPYVSRRVTGKTLGAAVAAVGIATSATMAAQSEEFPKSQRDPNQAILLDSAAYQIPHPEKKHKGGEDTLFISANGNVVGVFDGVGGWASAGVDPRDYALKLSQGAQEATDKYHLYEPLEVLRHAHAYSNKILGSSTACIVALDGGVIQSANLGDSGFMVLRPDISNNKVQLLYKSEEHQHSFNMPYQLGPQSNDKPDDAALYSMPVVPGDLIILGTDGLFDNIDEKVIATVVEKHLAETSNIGIEINKLAHAIAKEAFTVSQNRKAVSPFAIGAAKYGYRFVGGKPDDITVLISRVTTQEEVSQKKQTKPTPKSTSNEATTARSNKDNMSSSEAAGESSPSLIQRLLGYKFFGFAKL